MNPFTRALLERLQNRRMVDLEELNEFVADWDELEALIIRIYRGKQATDLDEFEYQQVRAWLLGRYPRWQSRLAPFWKEARVAGEPAKEDPFAFLLIIPRASGFVRNRLAMQTLPAAREALNRFLVEKIEGGR